jgi:Mn-dependent DtxR family transcriptional regulator
VAQLGELTELAGKRSAYLDMVKELEQEMVEVIEDVLRQEDQPTWEEIGRCMGVTKQSAHQFYKLRSR